MYIKYFLNKFIKRKLAVFLFFLLFMAAIFLFFGYSAGEEIISNFYFKNYFGEAGFLKENEPKKVKPRPDIAKGIYISSYAASDQKFLNGLIDLVNQTSLNSVVIDIKDFTGYLSYRSDIKLVKDLNLFEDRIKDIGGLLEDLHKNNIYVIGRVVVFQDSALAKVRPEWALKDENGKLWKDYKGLNWLDVMSRPLWDYIIDISREAINLGFDEINFDYVRFPSDGNLSRIRYPFWDGILSKEEALRSFFSYLREKLDEDLKKNDSYLSADIFGMVLTNKDDLKIGQHLETLAPYFDYLYPMVYPSHYPENYNGYKNPADYPYEIIYNALAIGRERLDNAAISTKFRPWLQDFNLGAYYNSDMIKLEIDAAQDATSSGWMIWNSRNVYTKEALY